MVWYTAVMPQGVAMKSAVKTAIDVSKRSERRCRRPLGTRRSRTSCVIANREDMLFFGHMMACALTFSRAQMPLQTSRRVGELDTVGAQERRSQLLA